MKKLTRGDVLRKCLLITDALKRLHSRGNAGLEPEKGAEDSFEMDQCMSETLREILREMEAGKSKAEETKKENVTEMKDWQKVCMERPPERLEL